jgi:hypothetical protein
VPQARRGIKGQGSCFIFQDKINTTHGGVDHLMEEILTEMETALLSTHLLFFGGNQSNINGKEGRRCKYV